MKHLQHRLRALKQRGLPEDVRLIGPEAADEIERLIDVCVELEDIDIENHADQLKQLREVLKEATDEVYACGDCAIQLDSMWLEKALAALK